MVAHTRVPVRDVVDPSDWALGFAKNVLPSIVFGTDQMSRELCVLPGNSGIPCQLHVVSKLTPLSCCGG